MVPAQRTPGAIILSQSRTRMHTSRQGLKLTLNGNRVLLPCSFGLLLLSALLPLSIELHWPESLRAIGVIGLLLSPAFLMLSGWEVWRYQHRWRTVLAAVIALLATATGWGTILLRVTGRL
jgi:hypothetical protein